jgi:hypothetical protein
MTLEMKMPLTIKTALIGERRSVIILHHSQTYEYHDYFNRILLMLITQMDEIRLLGCGEMKYSNGAYGNYQ